jgi:hypothetical protein
MSYLDPPRLHFAGKFAATISTVNNDPAHFDNATFKPEYQQRQDDSGLNGWFNPRGDGDWRLMACSVTGAVLRDGSVVADDPVLSCIVADSDRLPPAKLVDLDAEQQLVSTIWGLEMRICDASGENLLRAPFAPAAFIDIWTRSIGSDGSGDNSAAAMHQSVLYDLEWSDRVSTSPFLTELMTSATDGRLSVKLNVDGVNLDWNAPDFLQGRITGTIGVAQAGEPTHFVRGRQFMATSSGAQGFPVPAGGLNNCVASLDQATSIIHLDLGNALPTSVAGGPIADLGTLSLVYVDPSSGSMRPIGDIPYTGACWYELSAGVVSLPVPSDAVSAVASNQLLILRPEAGGRSVAIAEPATGLHCRADEFVYRLDAGETATVEIWASQWGQPYPNARINVIHDPYQLQPAPFGNAPSPGVPQDAVEFPETVVADANGIALLPIFARDPGNPRGFIDGQVYGVRPMLQETTAPGATYPFNVWEFVSVVIFDPFVPDEPPTWRGSLHPIFQQYANLYPLMADIVNLADYDSVCKMREMLLLAFEQPISSPNSMPATRDLSRAKRTAILRWLRTLGTDGNPLRGPLPPPAVTGPAPRTRRLAAVAEPGDGSAAAIGARRGGKASALARRLAFHPELNGSR